MTEVTGATLVSARFATVEFPLVPPVQSGGLVIASRSYCCVQVERADGVVGESYVLTRALPVEAVLTGLVLPRLLGTSAPSDAEALVALRNAGWSGPVSRAVSLVELARLDAAARAADQPVRRHLGHRDPVRLPVIAVIGYTSSGRDVAVSDVEEAERAAQLGLHMVKIMGGTGPIEADLDRVRRVAGVLAGACEVGLDVNGAWSVAEAERALPRLREAGASLVEDPYPYEQARHPTSVGPAGLAVALGEVLASPLEISALLASSPATHARLDVTLVGGPGLFRSAHAAARAAGMATVPHFWPEFHAHLLPGHSPAHGPTDMVECTLPGASWLGAESFVSGLPTVNGGSLQLSSGPGFGLELDWPGIARMAHVTGGVSERGSGDRERRSRR